MHGGEIRGTRNAYPPGLQDGAAGISPAGGSPDIHRCESPDYSCIFP